VIALLRYMTIKSMRDRSLPGLVLMPILWPALVMLGNSVYSRSLHYPLTLNPKLSAVGNATLIAQIMGGAILLLASIAAFWTLRPEVASRSIGAFVFGARPLTIVSALVVYATTIGIAGWIGSALVISVLSGAVPSHLVAFTLRLVAMTVAMSTAGALMVMISPAPATVLGAYVAAVAFLLVERQPAWQVYIAVGVTLVCTAVSTFLLERRWAT
jgi:hypothetical protein